MSTPQDSVAPLMPNVSDDPRRSKESVWSITNWFKEIRDWIIGLSPAGVSRYDSGVISTDLAFTPYLVEDIVYQMLRRGRTVTGRVSFTYIGETITAGPDGNFIDQQLFDMPYGWRPIMDTTQFTLRGRLYRVGAEVWASGKVILIDGPPGVTVTKGDTLTFDFGWELP